MDFKGMSVLAVDDEPDNIGVLELVFNFHEARIRSAESALDGLRMMEEESPALILADIQMPGMDGFEFLRRVRGDKRWIHIPIIAITALVMPGDEDRILAAGFDGYIPKPISPMNLKDDILNILARRQVRQ